MGSIDRHPNGKWRARYRDPNGRSRSRTFDRKGDAERSLQRNGTDLQHGEWIDPVLRRVLFSEWANLWWETTVKQAPQPGQVPGDGDPARPGGCGATRVDPDLRSAPRARLDAHRPRRQRSGCRATHGALRPECDPPGVRPSVRRRSGAAEPAARRPPGPVVLPHPG
jgi:hypothetical protein